MNTTNPGGPGTPPAAPGTPEADDHGGISAPSPETVARGYEADVYDNKTVLSVPLLVILFFVLAFGTVSVIFSQIAYPASDGKAHPGAAARNKRSLNDRLKDNERGPEHGTGQPRLEPLTLRSGDKDGKLQRAITRPLLPTGNSPELHPEDLRVTKDKFPTLYAGGAGKVGIDKTMSLSNEKLAELFPAQPGARLPVTSQHVPTGANAGRGADESQVIVPELPKQPEPKKDTPQPPKKEEPKKEEPKKEEPKKTPAPTPDPKGGKS